MRRKQKRARLTLGSARQSSESSNYQALEICFGNSHLSISDLFQLSRVGRAFRDACTAVVNRRWAFVLHVAVTAAATAKLSTRHHHSRVAQWVVAAAAPGAVVKLSAELLVKTPNVPKPVAAALLRAGLEVTWQQWAAASVQSVAGIEVWVQAAYQMHKPIDLHWAAEAVCLGDLDKLKRLSLEQYIPPEYFPYLLQLAFNLQQSDAADWLLLSLQDIRTPAPYKQQLTPPLVDQLLHTAAARRHTSVLLALDRFLDTVLPESINPKTVAGLFVQALVRGDSVLAGALSQMTVLERLPANDAADVLQIAMEQWCSVPFKLFSGALQLEDTSRAIRLWHTAIKQRYGQAVLRFLASMPASRDIDVDAWGELVDAATPEPLGNLAAVEHLCQLPARREFDATAAVTLFDAMRSLLCASIDSTMESDPLADFEGLVRWSNELLDIIDSTA